MSDRLQSEMRNEKGRISTDPGFLKAVENTAQSFSTDCLNSITTANQPTPLVQNEKVN